MKKRYFLVILVLCFLVMIGVREPLCSFETNQDIPVRYETSESQYPQHVENINVSDSQKDVLYDILQRKAWYVGNGWSTFLLAQNDISPEADQITLYFDEKMISISSDGVIYDITNEQYAYLSLIHNKNKAKEIYKQIYACIKQA